MNDGESSTFDPEYLPPRKVKKPKRLEKTILELPTKDLMKETASMCVRLKLSQILGTSLYAKIILSGGGDLKDIVISNSATFRHRILAGKETEATMKIQFMELLSANRYAILHWDGKQVKFQARTVEKYLVICLQEVASEPQFISAPQKPDRTGAAECGGLVRYIDDCRIK